MVCNTFLIFLYKFLHIFLVTADFICVIMTVVWHFVYKLPFNNESEEILMKRLQVLFLVALSSSLLLFGCGKKEEETQERRDYGQGIQMGQEVQRRLHGRL